MCANITVLLLTGNHWIHHGLDHTGVTTFGYTPTADAFVDSYRSGWYPATGAVLVCFSVIQKTLLTVDNVCGAGIARLTTLLEISRRSW